MLHVNYNSLQVYTNPTETEGLSSSFADAALRVSSLYESHCFLSTSREA